MGTGDGQVTNLPEHRRAIHARTWNTSWSPAAMDPIESYTSPVPLLDWLLGIALAVALGISGALILLAYFGD